MRSDPILPGILHEFGEEPFSAREYKKKLGKKDTKSLYYMKVKGYLKLNKKRGHYTLTALGVERARYISDRFETQEKEEPTTALVPIAKLPPPNGTDKDLKRFEEVFGDSLYAIAGAWVMSSKTLRKQFLAKLPSIIHGLIRKAYG